MRTARALAELFRITLPSAGFLTAAAAVVGGVEALQPRIGVALTLVCVPALYAGACAAVALTVAALKWIVMGRFRPFVRPLWSPFVWRLECVNALYEFLATPLVLEPLQGTPFLAWYLRLLGARIGRQTYLHTTGFLEFDLVEIGDRVALNEDCVMQTHLFEDRVLKSAPVRVAHDCSVGAESVVLYDSEMQPGSKLGPLSLLMKGEMLPANSQWRGAPARSTAPQHIAHAQAQSA
jgi:non-ribosomal peptide synthetase-like protein